MPKSTQIKICYINREMGCPALTQVFRGRDADILAANFQSDHPELKETECTITY